MKVINKGVEKNIKILTHFKFDTEEDYNTEYILYTDSENEGINLYLAQLLYENDKVEFKMPKKEKFEDLKKIIENLISNNPNSFIFSQKKYKYVGMEALEIRSLEEVETQKIQLNEDQYKNLTNNKYLSYPLNNMLNAKIKDKEYNKKNIIGTIIGSIVLVLFLGITLLCDPNLSHNIFNFDRVGCIMTDSIYNLKTIAEYGIPSTTILHLGIFALALSLFSFYYDESKPVLSYFLSFLFLIILSILFYGHLNFIDLASLGDEIIKIKILVLFTLINALILTICYQAFKGITLMITDALKIKNFIVHTAIFLPLFLIGYIGLIIFYDYNVYENVLEFITKIV